MATPLNAVRLSYELDRRGMTWLELAQRTGTQISTLSAARHGRPIRRQTLLRIVAALAEVPTIEGAELVLLAPVRQQDTDQGANPVGVKSEAGGGTPALR